MRKEEGVSGGTNSYREDQHACSLLHTLGRFIGEGPEKCHVEREVVWMSGSPDGSGQIGPFPNRQATGSTALAAVWPGTPGNGVSECEVFCVLSGSQNSREQRRQTLHD